MNSKCFIFKVYILLLSLSVILAGCGTESNKTREIKYSVAGAVLDGNGNPVADVSLAIQGSEIVDSSVEVSDDGGWNAGDLQGKITITPVKYNWAFEPPAVTITEEDAGKSDINFTGEEIRCPGVKTLTPEKDAKNVSPVTAVMVEFNQDVEVVDLSGIKIKDSDNNPVNGVTAGLSDRTINIDHDNFDYNKTHTVIVPAGTVTNTGGIGSEEIRWSFTIRDDLPVPDYVSLVPGENATDVELGAIVSIEFDQDIIEVDLSGIRIEDSDSNQVSCIEAGLSGRTIIVYDHDDFGCSKTYTVTVPAGAVANTNGIGNNEISWRFTTVLYKFVESWGDFRYPEGIAVDSSGNIYIADTQYNRIQKFDNSGNHLTQWGSNGSGNGEFEQPKGITVDSSNNIYVADTWNNRIQKFDSSGNYLGQWGSHGGGNGQFRYPEGIAVDSSGNIYVADTQNNRIQKFDSSGTYLAQWGSNGSGDGEFTYPMGITVDSSGNIYVADTHNHRIQKFDSTGNYLFQWGREGYRDGEFTYPVGITVDDSDNIYVVDSNNHRIQKFDSSENYLAQWGSHGDGDREFYEPKGITVDISGNIYVADTYNHRIQKFASGE